MSSADHEARGEKKGEFCARAPNGGNCECGNNYKDNGKAPATWDTTGVKFTSKKKKKAFKYFEAHHILSVSPVNSIVFGAEGIQTIVKSTVWCVNDKSNMIALPSMAHTIDWYEQRKESTAPPFANLPQHDWDHFPYLNDLRAKLKTLVKAVQEKAKIHKTKPKNIREDMVNLTTEFRTQLEVECCKRDNGTHAAYHAKACGPFSMASDANITKRQFPAGKFDDKFGAWKNRILGDPK